MRFGIPKETESGETRVAMVPDTVRQLVKKGYGVAIQGGAGAAAFISDKEYSDCGAEIVSDVAKLFSGSDCIVKVQPPSDAEIAAIPEGRALIGFLWSKRNPAILDKLKGRKIVAFSMDAIPRITRAQSMDALSSQATLAGYKAVLLGASHLPKLFPMLTTAAGTIRPAQAFILGAGVAGLQAIATARRLGAVVEAFDARPVVKEQVLSLGATFVEVGGPVEQDKYGYAKEATPELLAKQQKLLHERLKLADVVVTTAQVPGKTAPRLITAAMVADMKPGSVILDLAAETGGNCELTKANQEVVAHGVRVFGPTNLPATMPLDASRMYARNVTNLILELVPDPAKGFSYDWNNEIFKETCLTRGKEQ